MVPEFAATPYSAPGGYEGTVDNEGSLVGIYAFETIEAQKCAGNSHAPVLERFNYVPLSAPTSQIRLLRIPPKSPQPPTVFVVHMFHAHLSEDPKYTALSYTWGSPTPTDLIELNGQRHHTTESVFVVLHELQRENEDVVVWIDALCINQQDDIEKTDQVQLMRQIYKTAQEVVVWLGPSTPYTDSTMQETRKLGEQLLDMGLWDLTAADCETWELEEENTSGAANTKNNVIRLFEEHMRRQNSGDYAFWWIMSDLGERRWFRRMWCIQECANAEVAIFRCGKEEVDFRVYWAVSLYMSTFINYALLRPTGNDITDNQMLWLTGKIQETFPTEMIGIRRKRLMGHQHDLRSLLYSSNAVHGSNLRIECTDPRDRVYALLGIAADAVSETIVADYTRTLDEAYIATARALLNNGHDDVLSLCGIRTLCPDLPSWVPDWSSLLRWPWSVWHSQLMFSAGYNSNPSAPYVAFKPHTATPSRPDELRLEGKVIDTLKDVGTVWSVGIDDPFDYTAATALFNDISTYLSQSPRYAPSERQEGEWRILVGDIESHGMNIQRAAADGPMKKGVEVMKHFAEHYSKGTVADMEYIKANRGVMSAVSGRMQSMYDARLFSSETGWVGLCPMNGVPGDSIVLFLGARVPYLIRKVEGGEKWKLIGECHVYGIMDGEYMKEEPVFEPIILC
ncbi:HET-domain-containing protein [Amniculicola lignicola CBS 123094]|uniref:HET-domain-containing protein n=1 Tax=Amniculicola lignicola CBS 123094 TaxID=1392246 RepID=A0A6A5W5S6_9PLEO|nr:HET-domain-containing protein [Amniculicola lignicola CBS 123094]